MYKSPRGGRLGGTLQKSPWTSSRFALAACPGLRAMRRWRLMMVDDRALVDTTVVGTRMMVDMSSQLLICKSGAAGDIYRPAGCRGCPLLSTSLGRSTTMADQTGQSDGHCFLGKAWHSRACKASGNMSRKLQLKLPSVVNSLIC